MDSFSIVTKAVRIGLLIFLFSILYAVFNLWLSGLFYVTTILLGIYAMTFISIVPYVILNIIYYSKNRHDGRWIIYIGLSLSLLFTISVAFIRLMSVDRYITPIYIAQLRYDGTLALSMALLGLATLLYMGSVIPDARRIADRIALALREREEDAYEVEVV
jgi:phosphoglycerol transferase MdoB-like AlkP superfamily enzyme